MALVLVEAEVAVDAAGLVLGLPDAQTGQGQDDEHGDADEDPFHDLIHLPEDRLNEALGFGIPLAVVHKTVG